MAGFEDVGIGCAVGAHDHLRALPARREARHGGALRGRAGQGLRLALLARGRAPGLHMPVHALHGLAYAPAVLFRRELRQAAGRGQFHIDAQAVGMAACLGQQFGRGIRDGLEVDVAAKVMLLAQAARHFHQLLHGVVAGTDDAAGQEQPLDAVAPVEVQRQLHHLGHREAGALHVGALAVDAVAAVEDADIGQQDLEQRDAAPVGRIAVADAHAGDRAHALAVQRVAPLRSAGGAAGVVLGGVGEDEKFALQLHGCMNIQYICLAHPVFGEPIPQPGSGPALPGSGLNALSGYRNGQRIAMVASAME